MSFAAFVSQFNLDMIFSGSPRIPDYGEEVFADDFEIQLGGGPMVPAIILNRFGVKSRFGTFLSNNEMDITSNISKQLLDKLSMNYKNLYREDDNPVVVTSVSTFPEDRCFTCYNPRLHENYLSNEEVYDFYKEAKLCFVFEGYDKIFKKLKSEGASIVYDLGWHDDLDVKNLSHILEYTDVFTPNDKEAMKMTHTNNVQESLKILSKYVKHPIVKVGGDGCLTMIDNNIIHIKMPMKFDAVDTTGAGDNFLAGVMYGLYNGYDILECMKWGNALGGYSTTAVGCYGANITYDIASKIMDEYR
ncbi:sugar kinase [Vallitalea longa]|uniref:Sugar kinase n=1 Tax=Vallitalea longa TaxID=2936439 RepID=A0A9W5Y8X4_9FIRM|nr:PfkB family carbohydrate kinase [Vallitalea longa]GKX27953.1 sugar kinase [Vallitalea longa]